MKLNLHIDLDNATKRWVRYQNKEIRRITKSIVKFSLFSPMKPHVTLVMGDLAPGKSVRDVVRASDEIIGDLAPALARPYVTTRFYLEDTRGRYVFLDFAPDEAFLRLKRTLDEHLRDRFLVPEGEYSKIPHITVAHVEDRKDEVRGFLTRTPLPRNCGFTRVSLGAAGPKGTVISTLNRWPPLP